MARSGAPDAQSKDAIRRTNLAAAMSAIRARGSLSRPELVSELGLSRTTVAELVTQLRDAGLIRESDPLPSNGAGRPSYRVTPSPEFGAIAVNPESDVITAGYVGLDGTVALRQHVATPIGADPHEVAQACAALIDAVTSAAPPSYVTLGAGCAVPGQVRPVSGHVAAAPRLGWRDVDFVALLGRIASLPIRLDNNARLVAQTEHRARPTLTDIIAFFGGAGGIGAGVVSGGVLLRGANGFAGELGHIRIGDHADVDFEGKAGTLEAILKRDDLTAALGLDGDATDAHITRALGARVGASAERIIARQTAALGATVGNVANIFDPQLILLGGFLGSLFDSRQGQVRTAIREAALESIEAQLRVESTTGITDSVLIGAAELFLADVSRDPLEAAKRGKATVERTLLP